MRHRKAGRKLGRNSSHRRAMFRNMATSLIEEERIQTTAAKAKELRSIVEKLITLASRNANSVVEQGSADRVAAVRQAGRYIRNRDALQKLFGELAERFVGRPGGYTRVLRTGRRLGDNAEMAIIELLPEGYQRIETSAAPEAEYAATPAPPVPSEPVAAEEAAAEAPAEEAAAEEAAAEAPAEKQRQRKQRLRHLQRKQRLRHLQRKQRLRHLQRKQRLRHLQRKQRLRHQQRKQRLRHLQRKQQLRHLQRKQRLRHLQRKQRLRHLQRKQRLKRRKRTSKSTFDQEIETPQSTLLWGFLFSGCMVRYNQTFGVRKPFFQDLNTTVEFFRIRLEHILYSKQAVSVDFKDTHRFFHHVL